MVTSAGISFRYHWALAGLAIAGLVMSLSCSGGMKGLKGEDEVFVEPDFWQRAEAMFGEAGGGYWLREKSTEVRYEGGNWFVKEQHHYQIVVLDADKMDDYADISIAYGPSSRLTGIKARTITSAGEVIPVESAGMYDKSRVPGFMLYSDRKSRVFAMPGFADRCIVDVAYEIEDEALYFMDEFDFGSRLPVRRARYSYSLDSRVYLAGYRIYYRSYNVDAKPEDQSYETHFGKLVRWTWDVENLESYPTEKWMPPRERYLPRLALAGFAPDEKSDDWNVFTEWYKGILPKFDQVRPELDEFAREICGGAEGEAQILQRVMDYFGDNVRYVSITIRDSGWRPHPPLEVLEKKYGDCKDMACAAVAVLRRKGIGAYPALVRTKGSGEVDRSLTVPRFDHMIVYVDSDSGDIWLDPTAAPCPLGYLPHMDRDIDALVIKGKEAVWKHTPSTTPFGSGRTTVTSVTLTSLGALEGESWTTYSGDMGLMRKRAYSDQTPSELTATLEADITECFRDVTLDSCALEAVGEVEPLVSISGKFSKTGAAIRIEDRLVLRLDFLRPMVCALAEIPKGTERKYPLWFPFAWEEIDTLLVRIPDGWGVEKLPVGVSDMGRHGLYALSCEEHDGSVVAVLRNKLLAGDIQGHRLEDFVGFWTQARDRMNQEIVFRKL
jgi:hypothetical protein